MFRPLSLFIGLRYMRAKRRNHFISFIFMFTVLGLLIGTSVLILVLSVMNGFNREINNRILGAIPHVTMHGRAPLQDWRAVAAEVATIPTVEAVVPFVRMQGMLAANGRSAAVLAMGIDPQQEGRASIVDDFMLHGDLAVLEPGEFGMILGNLIAARLGVRPGEDVTLFIPQSTVTPLGNIPRLRSFTVRGIYSLGSEIDGNLILTHIADAAALERLAGEAEGLRLKLKDVFDAPAMTHFLRATHGDTFYIENWTRSYGNLFASIQLEKRLVGLLLFLIIAVASFNIVSTLVMLVTDKERDIAILRTMGASSGTILGIFIINGSLSGLIGTMGGVLLGIVLALNVEDFVLAVEAIWGVDFLSSETYFIDYLPSHLLWQDVVTVAVATFCLSILASIYPALRAAYIRPAEALRHE